MVCIQFFRFCKFFNVLSFIKRNWHTFIVMHRQVYTLWYLKIVIAQKKFFRLDKHQKKSLKLNYVLQNS